MSGTPVVGGGADRRVVANAGRQYALPPGTGIAANRPCAVTERSYPY
ncbi:hypothetical protein RM550_04480 [Streptomyces sp. DSM 41527]|uniref:Uncharacterized protein n=1 Tax=Streptomyces mooreae TaxID=3075523 RepID=A0ABU2T3Y2_9ACTN|nr:hypothetical protein [Streptomyces sp. DSM 41527]MDT0455000.1 hypothetical protein [Streptomyces sp. DSM 41527]